MDARPMLELVRPHQWYKNILVFLPLVFSLQLFDAEKILSSILGFAVLCAAFGGMYIINDIVDSERDKLHPKKSKRPIPSGRVGARAAVVTACILLGASLPAAFVLSPGFAAVLAAMILMTLAYSAKAKNLFLLDVVMVSGNFVLRAVGGTYLVDSPVSPWLIAGVFLAALLLALGKRLNELNTLKDMVALHRASLARYTDRVLRGAVVSSAASLVVVYAVYAASGPLHIGDWRLVMSVPFVALAVIRYCTVALSGRHGGMEFNDIILADRVLLAAMASCAVSILALLYVLPDHAFSAIMPSNS